MLKFDNQRKLKKALDNKYLIFSSTRNPYDRAWSCYQKMLHEKRTLKNLTFENFLSIDYSKYEYDWAHTVPITTYLFTWIHLINFWIRFENINEDFKTLCDKFGWHKPLKKINVSVYNEEEKYINLSNKNIRSLIEEKYKKDFDFFGYKKWKENLT